MRSAPQRKRKTQHTRAVASEPAGRLMIVSHALAMLEKRSSSYSCRFDWCRLTFAAKRSRRNATEAASSAAGTSRSKADLTPVLLIRASGIFLFVGAAKRELFPSSSKSEAAPMDVDADDGSTVARSASAGSGKPFVLLSTTLDEVQTVYIALRLHMCDLTIYLCVVSQDVLRVAAFSLNARVVTEFSDEVTHVVTHATESNGGVCARTMKYMFAVISRKYVVTFDCKLSMLSMRCLCFQVTFIPCV